MNPLIAPLNHLVRPGDRLVICSTGSLGALPLHALEIAREPLLQRHAITYTPSLGILEHCLAKRRIRADRPLSVALFGNPTGDRHASEDLLRHLAKRFGAEALKGDAVTKQAFQDAGLSADLLHFHGHAVGDVSDGLRSCLLLAAGERVTAAELFAQVRFAPQLVVLCACEGAANQVELGDEPVGIAPALLVAGARSVIAAQWRVSDRSAAALMTGLYDRLASGHGTDLAQALRQAALALRDDPNYRAPYHWAPFILQGDWRWEA